MRMIEIDGVRLRKAIERRGMTIYQASEGLDRSKSFFGNIIREHRISAKTMKELEATYKILPAEYERREEAENEAKTTETEDLKAIIAEAVLEALKRYPHEVIAAEMEKWRDKR